MMLTARRAKRFLVFVALLSACGTTDTETVPDAAACAPGSYDDDGDAATAWLDAFPETAHAVTVQRIWPTANRQKATVEVRLGFDARDERLRRMFEREAKALAAKQEELKNLAKRDAETKVAAAKIEEELKAAGNAVVTRGLGSSNDREVDLDA